jgi:hypothetical protein
MQSACAVLYCCTRPVRFYHIFPHYLIKGTTFGKKFIEHKTCVLIFSNVLSEIFPTLRRLRRDIITNLLTPSRKLPLFVPDFNETCIFSTDFRTKKKTAQVRNFIKIRPVTVELFHADGQRDTSTPTVACRNFANTSEKEPQGEDRSLTLPQRLWYMTPRW